MQKGSLVVVGGRNTGKTTLLLEKTKQLVEDGYKVIVLDSATEHEGKSLLRKVQALYPEVKAHSIEDESKVVIDDLGVRDFSDTYHDAWPYDIINEDDQIIGFDLSYFLEKGHDVYDETEDIEQYRYYRKLYNDAAQQLLISLILKEKEDGNDKIAIVMDEIEFPIVDYGLKLDKSNMLIIAAVHPENAQGTFYRETQKLTHKR